MSFTARGDLYKKNDPKGWCGDPSRGAALGRATIKDADKSDAVHLHVRRERLNSGGYDRNGTYFGAGAPLYHVCSEDWSVDYMLRAYDREDAIRQVREDYPNARVRK